MRITSLFALSTALTLAGSWAPLHGQDVRYGLQIHGNMPSGDLKEASDSKVGIGGGAHMTIDFGDGHVLRPRLDYVVYPENQSFSQVVSNASATGKFHAKDASLGLDYFYDFGGKDGGFYLTAGVAWHHWLTDYDYSYTVNSVPVSGTSSTNSNKAGAAAGAGFNFNPEFGVEARYVATKFRQGTTDKNAGALQLTALYRF